MESSGTYPIVNGPTEGEIGDNRDERHVHSGRRVKFLVRDPTQKGKVIEKEVKVLMFETCKGPDGRHYLSIRGKSGEFEKTKVVKINYYPPTTSDDDSKDRGEYCEFPVPS
jgi:hypothetical protein